MSGIKCPICGENLLESYRHWSGSIVRTCPIVVYPTEDELEKELSTWGIELNQSIRDKYFLNDRPIVVNIHLLRFNESNPRRQRDSSA